MSWACKECKGKKFRAIQKEETIITGTIFDKDGYKTMDVRDEETSSTIDEYLECSSCGNKSTVFSLIEDIAYWKREIGKIVLNMRIVKQNHKSNYRCYLEKI